MANIVRRDANDFVSLRDAMDRLFDQSFLQPWGDGGYTATSPAVDVSETNDNVVVKATVPGIKPEDLKITLTGDMLQISGEIKDESEQSDATYHVRERRYGAFNRVITLPAPVSSDKAQADFEHGVLTLTLPKSEQARPKTIKVTAKK